MLWILALGIIATLGYITNFCLSMTLCKQLNSRRQNNTFLDKIIVAISFLLVIASSILPIAMITVGIKHVLRASSYMRHFESASDNGSAEEGSEVENSEMLESVIDA